MIRFLRLEASPDWLAQRDVTVGLTHAATLRARGWDAGASAAAVWPTGQRFYPRSLVLTHFHDTGLLLSAFHRWGSRGSWRWTGTQSLIWLQISTCTSVLLKLPLFANLLCSFSHIAHTLWGFPGGSAVKKLPPRAGDTGSIPGSGKIPWRRKWHPTPVFFPGKSHGQRSLAGYSPWGHKSRTRLSDWTTTPHR